MADEIAKSVAAYLEGAKVHVERGTFARIVEGRRNGLQVRVRCRVGNDLNHWSVEAKGAGPLVLATIRRRVLGERGAIESGAIVEVGSGDADFDREWLVEGAPSDTTRSLLALDVRAAVLAAHDIYVNVDGGVVTAGASGPYGALEVQRGIDAVLAVRARLVDLAETPADAASRARASAEIAALRSKRDKLWARASWPARVVMVVGASLLVVAVVAGVFYGCGLNVLLE